MADQGNPMTERPILMSAPMVRAVLAGSKTQTRRIMRPQPVMQAGWVGGAYWQKRAATITQPIPEQWCIRDAPQVCPYGAVGDRLWVRETMRRGDDGNWNYAADGASVRLPSADERVPLMIAWAHHKEADHCVSIHMPRWASRITLEVTSVRVERLHDISSQDAIAEGIEACPRGGEWRDYLNPNRDMLTPRNSYRSLWESINGAGSWDVNPWVWCVSFKLVKP